VPLRVCHAEDQPLLIQQGTLSERPGIMQTKRLSRILSLLQALQSGQPVKIEDLAKRMGVNRRTVFRDLLLLEQGGIPFSYDRQTRCYSAARPSLLPPVTLTHAEALSLMMAMHCLLERPIAAGFSSAHSAGMKLKGMLPLAVQKYCGEMLERVRVPMRQQSDPQAIADALPIVQRALADRKKLRVLYDSYLERKKIEATLHPYHLLYLHRGWYLIAKSEEAGKVLTFKVERILQYRVSQVGYKIDPMFSLDEYFGNAWLMIKGDTRHHVVIRFLPMVAANVDEICWHKTQKTRFMDDGSLIFEVDVDGLSEISWWVLGYGDQAEVLDPAELRKMIVRHAQTLLAKYDGKRAGDRAPGGRSAVADIGGQGMG
jgi:proteasome accessory factor B